MHPDQRARLRIATLLALLCAGIAVLISRGAIPQSQAYFDFADQRSLAGVPNFIDVVSNLPFLLVGVAGLYAIASGRAKGYLPSLRNAYLAFFAGAALIAPSSAYFHWRPNNWTLFWDRAPMTIAFMAFVVIVVGEHIGWRFARPGRPNFAARLLWPLIGFGLLSVVYWIYTESRGAGDLRLYVIAQFAPMLLIPFILLWAPSVFGSSRYYWGVLGFYALAKVLEEADRPVYEWTGHLISGHSLKHVAAAAAIGCVLLAIIKRPPPENG